MADPLAPEGDGFQGPDSVVDWMIQQQRAAGLRVMQGQEENPDNAARAVQLGKATGDDPQVIYNNLDDYERNHKAALADALVNSNDFLRSIAASHPLAPTLAQDDWGQLSKVGDAMDQLKGKPQLDYTRGRLGPIIQSLDPGKAVDEAYPPASETRSKWVDQMPPGMATFTQNVNQYGAKTAFGMEMLAQVKEGLGVSWGAIRSAAALVGDPTQSLSARILGPTIGAPAQVAAGAGQAAFAPVGAVLKIAGDLYEKATGGAVPSDVFQNQMNAAMMIAGMPREGLIHIETARGLIDRVHEIGMAAKPLIDAGITPGLNVHPDIDRMWIRQAEEDLKNLQNLQSEVGKSTLRERAPDIFEAAMGRELNTNIGIKAEAVRKLYGDKQITLGDGLLGDAGNVAEQLILAEAHGGDIEVPMAKWLSKVDPEVQKALEDDIRVRPQGVTVNEGKEIGERLARQEEQAKVAEAVSGEQAQAVPSAVVPSPRTPLETMRRITGTNWSPITSLTVPRVGEPVEGLYHPNGIVPTGVSPTEFGERGFKYQSLGSFTAKDGLALIRRDEIKSKLGRAAYEFLGDRLYRLAGDTPVHVVSNEVMDKLSRTANAYYHPDYHHIVVRDTVINGSEFGHEYAASVLTEEMWHAATSRSIRADKALDNKVNTLRQITIDYLREHAPDLLNYHRYELKDNDEFLAWFGKIERGPTTFKDTLSQVPISPALRRTFGFGQGLSNLWDLFRSIIKEVTVNLFGKTPTESVLDALMRMGPELEEANRAVRATKREGPQLRPEYRAQYLSPIESGREDPILERIRAYGMNKKRAENYMKLVEKARAEDDKWQREQGEKRERQQQTEQWKQDLKQMREDVRKDMLQKPVHMADRLLLTGEWQGKRGPLIGLSKEGLTPEQIASIPNTHFRGKTKITADQLARATGFPTGDRVVEALVQLHADRTASGLSPADHFRSLVRAEADRQMELVHGKLEENILADAAEHVLGPSSLDVTSEELLAAAERAGVTRLDKYGIEADARDKDGIKAAMRAQFDKTTVDQVSREKYQSAAGRHAQAIEDEFAKGDKSDVYEVLKLKSQQVMALHLAKFAKDLEKEVARDTKLRKNLAKTEPTGVDPEYAIWAQDILTRTGTFVRRTVQGMERQKDLASTAKSLREFVDQVNSASGIWDPENGGYNLPVPDFLMDPSYRKATGDMTVDEFRATALALKALNQLGREERTFVVGKERYKLEDVRDGLIDSLQAFYGRELDPRAYHPLQWIGMQLLSPETWFSKIDLFDPNGRFQQLLIRPVIDGNYESLALRKEMARDWKEVATFTEPGKMLPDSPLMRDGKPIPMTKENAYVILANMGNDLQRKKLAGGYGVKDVQQIWNWLGQVLTKEDMGRQAKIGEFWEKWFGKSEEMYAKLRGWIPDRIELGQVQTPWGVYKEWYHPLIKDPIWADAKLTAADILDNSGYFRPAPGSQYTKGRTGAIYPIDLTFQAVARRAEEIANDIAMRPPITEVSKIFLDKKFKDAMTKYMGPQYQKAIEPWLRDSAGQRRPGVDSVAEFAMNYIRQNITTLLIGLNWGTFFKHTPTALAFSMKEVGPLNFADSMLHMLHETDTGQARWKFAWENSQELPNRLRNARESMGAVNEDVFKRVNWDSKFFRVRDIVQNIGAAPVAFGDLLSSVPMWDAKYRELRDKGVEHGDAVTQADRAVRNTHGSTIIANRPAALRQGGLTAFLFPFYNFFNRAGQRLYEYAWMSKLAVEGRTLPEMTGFEQQEFERGFKHVPTIMGGLLIYAIVPSLIEQAVDPLPTTKGESRTWYWSKALFRAPISMVPIARDVVNGLWGGHDVGFGLFGSAANDITEPFRVNWIRNPDKGLRGAVDAFGALTGLTYHSNANLLGYLYNLHHGKEKGPSGVPDIVSILRHGTLKEQRRR